MVESRGAEDMRTAVPTVTNRRMPSLRIATYAAKVNNV
jgi:hypothetical protein